MCVLKLRKVVAIKSTVELQEVNKQVPQDKNETLRKSAQKKQKGRSVAVAADVRVEQILVVQLERPGL
jgi:hypothetical protein